MLKYHANFRTNFIDIDLLVCRIKSLDENGHLLSFQAD